MPRERCVADFWLRLSIYVAGVSNFNEIGGASAIADVSKAFRVDALIYRNVSKRVPKKHGQPVTLAEAAEEVEEINAFRQNYGAIWQMASELEGVTRAMGQHAAGVVVASVPIVDRGVIERRKGDSKVVNWDKNIVEKKGLVKLDILGLSALDLFDLTLRYIRERHSKKVNLLAIPLDDKKVLDNFAAGKTIAVFQMEGGGMRKLLKDLGAGGSITFEDITAATALYRPGPMESGMMDSFAKRKQGLEPVTYDHPLLEPILKDTYGVITYQEQTMQIARVVAGYSAPDADKLRKIIGKKLPEEMKKERSKFVDGIVKTTGETEEWAGALSPGWSKRRPPRSTSIFTWRAARCEYLGPPPSNFAIKSGSLSSRECASLVPTLQTAAAGGDCGRQAGDKRLFDHEFDLRGCRMRPDKAEA